MAQRIFTLADARDERRNAELPALARAAAARLEAERIAGVLRENPAIGVLCRNGRSVFYVNFPCYREAGDPAALVAIEA
jgi:hypothetical protein